MSGTDGQGASTPGGAGARLEVVDMLRGFALAGLFLVHMIASYELYWNAPTGGPVVDTVFLLLLGKSFSLLALCFGFSFFILMDNAERRGVDFTARFAWRLTVLFAIGTLHSLVFRGDIIQLLAAMGFALLALNRIRDNRLLLWIALFCLIGPTLWIQMAAGAGGYDWANRPAGYGHDPAMPIYVRGSFLDVLSANLTYGQAPKWAFLWESGRLFVILGLYIVGLVLGRIGFFSRPEAFVRGRRIALAIAVPLTVLLWWAKSEGYNRFWALRLGTGADRAFATIANMWFELAAMAVWALVLIAAWQWRPAQRLLQVFAPAGRLTLTYYFGQSLVFIPVFYGFGLGLWDDWSAGTRLMVALLGVAAQLAFAAWWLNRFRYGPIEWLWRAATYTTWNIPFRRRTPA
ncbi:DUF418 domain-containing protein [Sphingomonas sp. G-3-2-10]|uniref:DUF418 domain-containing protein n=1 Tax=Sphingomonas sp. G-3-2-10 TaxID=2728838 RepID=UPI00146A551A|nr:DUF418 domain-containing protein [Sphingomonas sp. G-3-2-10]NML06514.1 DUF418 domain-containing protein [Sphingomonas sp. G-3-2-10]